MAADRERESLRATFDQVPELYDRLRPAYPEALIEDLVALAGLHAGARVLEIGPGTGQATRALAGHGLRILAVELGAGLAALARRNLASVEGVQVVHADIERWQPAPAGFDAVVAFTAFHWLAPGRRYARSAELLRDGGALAVVETSHVLPAGGDPFWAEVQEDYDAVVPSEANRRPAAPEEIGDLAAEMQASGLFAPASVRRQLWDVAYTSEEYIALLDTYSSNRALDAETRRRLFERIARRIEARPGRRVRKTYLATLTLAPRLPRS